MPSFLDDGRYAGRLRALSAALTVLLLNACAQTGARPVPDTAALGSMLETLERAERSHDSRAEAPPAEALQALMPGLSLSQELLTPVEPRFNIEANRQPAREFFSSLVAGTDLGVVVSPRVEGEISISLPNITIDEAMQTIQRVYGYNIQREGNIYQVQPPGLQTRIFSIDYLDVQRSGSSSTQVSSGSSGAMGGAAGGMYGGVGGLGMPGIGGAAGFGGVGGVGGIGGAGGFGGFGGVGGVSGFGGVGGIGGAGGVGSRGAGSGGMVTTQTETDFWRSIKETLEDIVGVDEDNVRSAGLLSAGAGEPTRRRVVVQSQVGMVMVTAYPEELDRVGEYLDLAQEILSREVIIQVQFLEVILDKGYQTAIDFDTFGPGGADNPNRISGSFSSGGDDSGFDAISNPLSVVTSFTDFNAVFQILNSRGTTQVLSSPSLKVLNNQKAVFQDGDEEFFQTNTGTNVVTTGQVVSESSGDNLQPFFSGISMDITPQISADGSITLHVHPTITSVTEQRKAISGEQVPLARTTVRELDSIIRAEDGKIVVLGGLAYERNVDDAAGVPLLHDLPIFGGLFDQRRSRTVKSEFVILLRPVIANSQNEQRMLRESSDRIRGINRDIDPFSANGAR